MTIQEIVEKYIETRDRKATLKAECDAKLAKFDEVLTKMEVTLLKAFEENGMESVRTEFGTAYKSVRTSAQVADWDIVLQYIKDNGAWEMLERRVNKKAVEAIVSETEQVPPGVNIRQEVTVNVRRT